MPVINYSRLSHPRPSSRRYLLFVPPTPFSPITAIKQSYKTINKSGPIVLLLPPKKVESSKMLHNRSGSGPPTYGIKKQQRYMEVVDD